MGVFFPLRNNWNIGIQGQGFITQLNYTIINGVDDQLYEFKRKHGGFSAGLAVRKGFIQKKLIPKAPVTCPTCNEIPELRVQFGNSSLSGASLNFIDSTDVQRYSSVNQSATAPVISWRSTTPNPRNETFTARLHYRPDSVNTVAIDSVIAQLENTTDTSLAFPPAYFAKGQIKRGFYYVTVHNKQVAKCGTCMSEVATTSFASIRPPINNPDCKYNHKLERLEVFYRTPAQREVSSVCYCQGSVVPGSEVKKNRLVYSRLNRRLSTGEVSFDTNTVILNLRELPGNLAQAFEAEKSKIENSAGIRYKGRRVRPQVQNFRTVFTVTKQPCNGQPEQVVGSFIATISDDTYSITDLKPLTDDQKAKLLAPPAPVKKRATRRRAGNSGRRSDVLFGVE